MFKEVRESYDSNGFLVALLGVNAELVPKCVLYSIYGSGS